MRTAVLAIFLCMGTGPLIVGASAPSVSNQPQSDGSYDKAREAVELFGGRQAFASFRSQLLSMMTELDGQVAPGYYDILVDSVRRGLEPDPLFELCVSRFAARSDESNLDAWLEWLRTPAVQAIVQEENRADAASQWERETFVEGLTMAPPTVEREALIDRLGHALDSVEVGFATYALGRDAILTGLNQSVPDAPAVQAQSEVYGLTQDEIALVTELTRQDLLFKYRNISASALEDYAAFWESALGKATMDALVPAVLQALRTGCETTGRLIGEKGRPYLTASGDPAPPGMPKFFEKGNFSFNAPADMAWAPWQAELVHPGAIAGYIRSAPEMYLFIAAESMDTAGMQLSLEDVVPLIRTRLELTSDAHEILYQEPYTNNGYDGLLVSARIDALGHTLKYLHWVYIRDRYVYEIVSHAREATPDDQFLALAQSAFSGFQLLEP